MIHIVIEENFLQAEFVYEIVDNKDELGPHYEITTIGGTSIMNWIPHQYEIAKKYIKFGQLPIVMDGTVVPYSYRLEED